MPLSATSSYLPVLREFLFHWDLVDAELPAPLVLQAGARSDAVALAAELEGALSAVREARLMVTLRSAEVQELRAELRGLLEQWGDTVRAWWGGSSWAELVPLLPPQEVSLDRFLRPFREALRLWALIEGEPAPPAAPVPLRIGPGDVVGRAEFTAKVEALRLKGLAWEEAGFSLDVARARRDVLLKKVRTLLMEYTKAAPARLGTGHALMKVLPRLWPLPGHTPQPVVLEGAWVPEAGVARLSWTGSEDALLDHYQVRACAGPDYVAEEESVVARVPGDAERVLETGRFLDAAGAVACFRVYVVLSTGNERASEPVVVRRAG